MAETQETITNLTEATLHLVDLQLRRQRIDLNSKEAEQLKEEIAITNKKIKQYRDLISIQGRTYKDVEREIEQKKAIEKETQKTITLIKQMGLARKAEAKAIEDIQRKMKIPKQYDTSVTLGSLGKLFSKSQFGAIADQLGKAGGWGRTITNTFRSLSGSASVLGGVFTALIEGGKLYYKNVLMPSIQTYNKMGQQLGVAFENRNLFVESGLLNMGRRLIHGESIEQWQAQRLAASDILRINPFDKNLGAFNRMQLDDLTESFSENATQWGLSLNQMTKTMKAYQQAMGWSGEKLGTHFDLLMRYVEDTGWTTQEFADALNSNVMYLKNFGVNLDNYAIELRSYGNWIKQEKLSIAQISAGGWQQETTGNLAFMAQQALRSGILTEEQLGAGLGSGVIAQSGAMREYLGKKIKAGELKEVVDILQANPAIRNLMATTGALSNKYAFKELLTRFGLPLTSEFSQFNNLSATDFQTLVTQGAGAIQSSAMGLPPATEKDKAQMTAQAFETKLYGLDQNAMLGVLFQASESLFSAARKIHESVIKFAQGKVRPITSTSGGSNANT